MYISNNPHDIRSDCKVGLCAERYAIDGKCTATAPEAECQYCSLSDTRDASDEEEDKDVCAPKYFGAFVLYNN